MYCNSCGQNVPNGTRTCMFCGARISGSIGDIAGNPFKIEGWDDSERKQKMLGARQNLESLKTNRLISMILSFVTIIITVWALVSSINREVETMETMQTVLILVAVAALIIGIWYLVIINNMSYFVSRFSTAFAFGIADLAISFLKSIADYTLLSLTAFAVGLLFAYHFYGAMEELSGPVFRDVANRWRFMWVFTIIMIIVSVILAILVGIAAMSGNDSRTVIGTILVLGVAVSVEVLEYLTVCKTVDAFTR